MKRILIIEREYGSGASVVAEKAAQRLGWKLLDRALTAEIAKLAQIDPSECEKHEERVDSWLYRLGKVFWRGSHETSLTLAGPEILDADRMVTLVRQVIERAAETGHCVLVGRGAPYFLRNRSDTFSVFLYAPREWKIRFMEPHLGGRAEAEKLVETVDPARAAFIKHYFGKHWPERHLYHLMLNTVMGIETTVDTILNAMQAVDAMDETRLDLP